MFTVGDSGWEWAKRAAHRAAALQRIVNRLAADTEIVMLILSRDSLG